MRRGFLCRGRRFAGRTAGGPDQLPIRGNPRFGIDFGQKNPDHPQTVSLIGDMYFEAVAGADRIDAINIHRTSISYIRYRRQGTAETVTVPFVRIWTPKF